MLHARMTAADAAPCGRASPARDRIGGTASTATRATRPAHPSGVRGNQALLRAGAGKRATADRVPAVVHEVLRAPGAPLDAATRAAMETRFGHDFGRVRVHSDGRAAESAQRVDALAYTVGRDIVFGAAQYAPASAAGRE